MAEAELRNMIMNFRVSDLQVLLGFAGRNKTGKKQELQSRALDLVKLRSPAVEMKIRELHKRRYHHQLVARPNNYEMQDTMSERLVPPLSLTLNNTYASRCNTNVRSYAPVNPGIPSSSYSAPSKPYIPPTPVVPHSNYAVHPNVKLKELPFYDVLAVLMRPTSLVPDANERFQESTYIFHLTPQQAHDVAISKDSCRSYDYQIQLRFCLLETSCEQEDSFPPSICVKVNEKVCPLPNPIPTNRPGVEPKRPSRPVNITSLCRLSPTVSNVITVSWASTYGRAFVAAAYLVRKLTSTMLLDRLKSNGLRNPDYTTAMIKEKLQQGQDADISTTTLRGSLICPLGKIKMELPCRAVTCLHLQCFDASLYIQMNEKKPKWICPVCDKPALFRTLAIDGLFMDIASKVPQDCVEVQFNEDGSWTSILPVKEPKDNKALIAEKTKRNSKKDIEVVNISSDSDLDDDDALWDSLNSTDSPLKMILEPDESPVTLSSPVEMLIPDTHLSTSPSITAMTSSFNSNMITVPTTNSDPFYPTSTLCSDIRQPESIFSLQSDTLIPELIIPLPESSLPSVSSPSPVLNSTYPQIPFTTSEQSVFRPPTSSPFQEQLGPNSSSQSAPTYPGFDFYSLLQISDIEPHKPRESERKDITALPDVISLD